MDKYNIVFDGALREGVTQDEAATNMAKVYGSDQAQVASLLFSGKRSILKRDLSAEQADELLDVLKNAGLIAVKEAAAPTFSLVEEAPPAAVKPNEAEAADKGVSSGGWMGAQGTHNADAAVMSAYGRGNGMGSTARPQSSTSYLPSGDDTEEFAELNWLSFEGRLGRIRYLAWAIIFGFAVGGAAGVVGALVGPIALGLLMFLAAIAAIVFNISLTVRRLHDINASGWLALLLLVPVLGNLFALALLFWPGTAGENDYGPPPPPNPIALNIMLVVGIVLFVVMIASAVGKYDEYVQRAREAKEQQR
ncbi:MAG: DUF805 domain-containing protein [Betaproteobacteria bacterium]|nr:DUF805 domain-containing protein [Betaproteobacteria bacterium]